MKTRKVVLMLFLSLFLTRCEQGPDEALKLSHLDAVLAGMEDRYDPAEKMLVSEFSSPGYHTTLKGGMVHRTRRSLTYAAACLDSEQPQLFRRGLDIIERVIQLQDQDPQSRTYGIWPWFLEEPLEKMAPPDWNWADFCGVQLLNVVIYHGDKLPDDLLERVNDALFHAAQSIKRRNVGPGYTNIAIMGTYVTMMVAELQALPDLKAYAQGRLDRFYDFTMENGSFREYNSPTYTLVALEELSRMRRHFTDRKALDMVEELYFLAWEEIALHFFPPALQWAGPHSRSYHTLLPENKLAFIQKFTSDAVQFENIGPFTGLEAHRLECDCPPQLESYFVKLDRPRRVRRRFAAGENPVVGTTYLHPDFCMGSVNRGDLWNQRRPFVAYWGDSGNPAYLRLRFLHDGYDFAAAQFFSIQEKGTTLFGVVPATDGGDTHVSLDPIRNGTITADDLRLRFEFGGAAAQIPVPVLADGASLDLDFNGLDMRILLPFAKFDGRNLTFQCSKDDDHIYYDVVFYHGESRELKLTDLKNAAVAVVLQIGKAVEFCSNVQLVCREEMVMVQCGDLTLNFPVKPQRKNDLLPFVQFENE